MFDEKESGLLEKARGGDSEAMVDLVLSNKRLIMGIYFRICDDKHEFEDFLQEILFRFTVRGLTENFDSSRGRFRTYLGRVARNLAIDSQKKRRIRLLSYLENDDFAIYRSKREEPTKVAEKSEITGILHEAISELPTKFSEVVFGRYWDGLNYRELDERLELSAGTARSRVLSAHERLSKILKGKTKGINDLI